MIFNEYASYYDLLYNDKNYKKEVDYINKIIKTNFNDKKIRILDIGCGTGLHANLLSSYGHEVVGIDLSEEMINLANKNKTTNTKFYVADATNFKIDHKFDLILSLFHVFSYQNTNDKIQNYLTSIYNHLNYNGLFIFDFWYGPAVLNIKPSNKIKRLKNNNFTITRIAESITKPRENTVVINYELIIINEINTITTIHEKHIMRYFFEPEVDFYLTTLNFKIDKFEEWITSKTPSENTWGVCCICQKIAVNN